MDSVKWTDCQWEIEETGYSSGEIDDEYVPIEPNTQETIIEESFLAEYNCQNWEEIVLSEEMPFYGISGGCSVIGCLDDSESDDDFDPSLVDEEGEESICEDEILDIGWTYEESILRNATVGVDDVDQNILVDRFLDEGNAVCDRLQELFDGSKGFLRPGRLLKEFITEEIITAFVRQANINLRGKNEEVRPGEMFSVLLTYLVVGFYRTSFTALFDEAAHGWMRQDLPVPRDRCLALLRALVGREREQHELRWEPKGKFCAIIAKMESLTAAINREIVQFESSVWSLDDDHIRQSAQRRVAEETGLRVVNNKAKPALGPVQTAVCSALCGFL